MLEDSQGECRELIRAAFGEKLLVPRNLDTAPVLARFVNAVTPHVAGLRPCAGVNSVGEELAHLLGSLEQYLRDLAPGSIGWRPWLELIQAGEAYPAYEKLRWEADQAAREIQPERELNYPWLGRPVKAIDILWHVAGHTAHHRGRLALLMRLGGVEPPQT
jgi:uncharacterized damage-inducible protein DinB